MNYQNALSGLKNGKCLSREGWNGKDQFIFLVPGSSFVVNRRPLNVIFPEGTLIQYQPHIDIYTAQATVSPWLASQGDQMADDWIVVDSPAVISDNEQ